MSKQELVNRETQKENKFQELQIKMNEMIVMQQAQLDETLSNIKVEQIQQKERLDIIKQEHENARDVEIKRHRVAERNYGFIGLSDLGQSYEVSIGAKTMGKLLRIVGLAKRKKRTEPMRSATLNNFAKSIMYGDYPTYQWNPEKCIEKIDVWLEDNGFIDEFYSIAEEKELMEYINNLYERYGN